jgi:multiple sugar transport system permease protein
MINIWQWVGYTALLIFAGLQAIPGSVYEAAADRRRFGGADVLEGDRCPLLRPVLVFVMVTSVIGSFQVFDYDCRSPPGAAPSMPPRCSTVYIYEQAFCALQHGLCHRHFPLVSVPDL